MLGRRVFVAGALALVVGGLAAAPPVQASHSTAERLSEAYGGGNPNDDSVGVEVSRNGRYVAFSSLASNLVSASDTNGTWDAFLYDRQNGTTTRVSKSSSGTEGNAESYADNVANDGTVVFSSAASNLVGSDTNGTWDVFVHEPDGDTLRVSVSSTEGQGNGDSVGGSISTDADRVAFWSDATNLGGSPGAATIYLRERSAGATSQQVSTTSDTSREPLTISGNGESIVFMTIDSLHSSDEEEFGMDIYLHDIAGDSTSLLSVQESTALGEGFGWQPAISYNGRWVVFHGNLMTTDDQTWTTDLYLLDRNDGSMEIVSVNSSETQSDEWSQFPSVSDDGRYIAFHSQAENLDGSDLNYSGTDVYVRDRQNGTTHRLNIQYSSEPYATAYAPAVAPGGGFVIFEGDGINGVSADTNGASDIFEFDL